MSDLVVNDAFENAIAGAAVTVLRRRAAALHERAKVADTSTAAHLSRLARDWSLIADEVEREYVAAPSGTSTADWGRP